MDKTLFVSRLGKALTEERRKLLDQELKTDFAILKRQRIDEVLPPKIYWALKCLPESFVTSAVSALPKELGERGRIKKIIKKRAGLPREKLIRFLAGRGFPIDLILDETGGVDA